VLDQIARRPYSLQAGATRTAGKGADMETTRVRFGSILEWLLAAAFIAAATSVASIVAGEFGSVRAVMPVIAGERPVDDAPAGLPPRAVSVPMLLLDGGAEVHLGDRASEVAARLGNTSPVLSESRDRNDLRERVTRVYDYPGKQFVLVFEGSGREVDPQVTAIYIR
jgi:hypothetical protein